MPTDQPRAPRRAAQAVTDARASVEEDRSRRMRHYLLAMGVRTLSFPVAVWSFVQGYYVLAGTLAVLAAVLPSFAVMIANAADRRQAPPVRAEVRSPVQGLGPAPAPEPGEPEPPAPLVIPGTIVEPGTGGGEGPSRRAS